ncbi:MAG: tryptophan-rich sensory protein [Candidatus Aminicenantes bacterium]|nr:MAG: tryptophan-rich sensory protein [Candidatus Aminicenantes bacterium]
MGKKDLLKLIISLIICQLAGVIGSLFTSPAIPTWYASLKKPSFNPPNWVFSPVWITLFVLMGISLFLLWRKTAEDKKVKTAVMFFAIQLVLNMCWSAIFFGLKAPFFAFIEIIFLWIAILLTILKSYKVSKAAGALLIPYILWVSFAAVLNFFLWNLNA